MFLYEATYLSHTLFNSAGGIGYLNRMRMVISTTAIWLSQPFGHLDLGVSYLSVSCYLCSMYAVLAGRSGRPWRENPSKPSGNATTMLDLSFKPPGWPLRFPPFMHYDSRPSRTTTIGYCGLVCAYFGQDFPETDFLSRPSKLSEYRKYAKCSKGPHLCSQETPVLTGDLPACEPDGMDLTGMTYGIHPRINHDPKGLDPRDMPEDRPRGYVHYPTSSPIKFPIKFPY